MGNLLKAERYKLFHSFAFWVALMLLLIYGFYNANEYIEFGFYNGTTWDEVFVTSFSGLFNSLAADQLFILPVFAGVMAYNIGREFSTRTLAVQVASGLNRRDIFVSKAIVNTLAYVALFLSIPMGAMIKGIFHYGIGDPLDNILNVIRTCCFTLITMGAVFITSMLIAFLFKSGIWAGITTAVTWFVLTYVFAMAADEQILVLNIWNPIYHFRHMLEIGSSIHGGNIIDLPAILVSICWVAVCSIIMWKSFAKRDLK
jgi:ABC-type transport system involved in multi-copper enzyme maturation permease subunit